MTEPPLVSPDGRFWYDGKAWQPLPSDSTSVGDGVTPGRFARETSARALRVPIWIVAGILVVGLGGLIALLTIGGGESGGSKVPSGVIDAVDQEMVRLTHRSDVTSVITRPDCYSIGANRWHCATTYDDHVHSTFTRTFEVEYFPGSGTATVTDLQ
jgi:hypothetical protein